MKDNFEFILNKDLKNILNRDYRNANKALDYKLFKSAIVLYGGLIEGMLLYFLLLKVNDPKFRKKFTSMKGKKIKNCYKEIKELRFDQIIRLAYQSNIIDDPGDSYFVKHFRNYVHIFKELEGNFIIGSHNVKTVQDFTEDIIENLRENWANRMENGKLFFKNNRPQYVSARNNKINKNILEQFYKRDAIDFNKAKKSYLAKQIGAVLGKMSGRGVCQPDPMSWDMRLRNFQQWIFNPSFKKHVKVYLGK